MQYDAFPLHGIKMQIFGQKSWAEHFNERTKKWDVRFTVRGVVTLWWINNYPCWDRKHSSISVRLETHYGPVSFGVFLAYPPFSDVFFGPGGLHLQIRQDRIRHGKLLGPGVKCRTSGYQLLGGSSCFVLSRDTDDWGCGSESSSRMNRLWKEDIYSSQNAFFDYMRCLQQRKAD